MYWKKAEEQDKSRQDYCEYTQQVSRIEMSEYG